MGRTFKQWMIGGPEIETPVEAANRMTKEFIDFHNKKFEKPGDGSESRSDLQQKEQQKDMDNVVSPM